MFANDKNIDNLQQLLAELKKYAELQKDYVKLHLVEKLTILILSLIHIFFFLQASNQHGLVGQYGRKPLVNKLYRYIRYFFS